MYKLEQKHNYNDLYIDIILIFTNLFYAFIISISYAINTLSFPHEKAIRTSQNIE